MTAGAIDVQNVRWIHRGQVLLENINLAIPAGTSCAVLGPNGAGKSALMALLSGYLWPTQGQVIIGGQPLGQVAVGEVRQGLGLVEPSRSPDFPSQMTTREVVTTGLFGTIQFPLGIDVTKTQAPLVEKEMATLGITTLAQRRFRSLSTGEKMKTLLGRALVGQPKLLILDEPTVGLDMGARAACVATLDQLMERPDPPTLIVVSHHLDELPSHLDHLILLKAGSILKQGTPAEVLTDGNLSHLFNCSVHVTQDQGRYLACVQAKS